MLGLNATARTHVKVKVALPPPLTREGKLEGGCVELSDISLSLSLSLFLSLT